MSWIGLGILLCVLASAVVSLWLRRQDLSRTASGLVAIADAKRRGSDKARLQFPDVDLAQCIGCGICVAACPEEGVLEIVHGQALVAHGARCVGHGLCAVECPVGAIAVTLGDVSERTDLPALQSSLEAVGTPGVYLAGEVTGYALIRTAIEHGSAAARRRTSCARSASSSRASCPRSPRGTRPASKASTSSATSPRKAARSSSPSTPPAKR